MMNGLCQKESGLTVVAHNQYYLWFHVLEDEMSHRGQIRMIKNKLFEN